MRALKVIVALILALLTVLMPTLSSCALLGGEDETDSTGAVTDTGETEGGESESESEKQQTEKYLFSDGVMKYRVVYASGDNEDVKTAANTFCEKLASYVENKDFLLSDVTADDGKYPEILIGNTNREESAQVAKDLGENSFIIKTVNGQIVIVAQKDWIIADALGAFMEKIEFAKGNTSATIAEDLNVEQTLDGKSRERWANVFPAYEGGILSSASYRSNYGLSTITGTISRNYSVVCAYETNLEEFLAYVDKLKAAGYEAESVANSEGVVSYWISRGADRMYIYLSKNAGEARFIVDKGDSATVEEFSYTYDKQAGDTTVLYQYGFVMSDHGKNIYEYYKDEAGNKIFNTETSNCGELLIFKLADNSVMIIDGASHYMTPDEALAGLDSFLHEITGTPEGGRVRIANWLMTHSHRDHFSGFARFLNVYHENYDVERVTFNFNYIDSLMPDFFNKNFKVWYPDAIFHRPHTGETLTIADITIDIMYTYEDSIDAKTGEIILDKMPQLWGGNPAIDQNNQSIVARITFDGKTFFMTGDIAYVAQDVLLTNYTAEELKMDILSVSHHGLNPLEKLYAITDPSITLCSQKKEAAPILNSLSIKAYNSYVACTEGGLDNVYFAGNYTAGVSVGENGELVVETRDIVGGIWDGKDIYGQKEAIPAH